MSWQIPQQIEQDIIAGKAQYRTFQTGVGGQSILPVPNNAYAVVFGYDFSPAGGGIIDSSIGETDPQLLPDTLRWFETQQISFYTGTDFYPFIHHVDSAFTTAVRPSDGTFFYLHTINNSPIARQIYITSDKDITISVGLLLDNPVATSNAIPQTNRTPALLSYGGSAQVVATQTDFGPAATPVQFMQPSPKDYQDFAFGLLPNGANNQAFATPDPTRGLLSPTQYLGSLGGIFRSSSAANYFLCLHYALYTRTIPEQRG